MGQATLELPGDLPDPLDLPPVDQAHSAPVSAAALASADDLLSQLAGEDIDRLLAEAENAGNPAVPGTPVAKAPPIEEPIVAEKAPEPAGASTDAVDTASLEAMLDELVAEPAATPAPPLQAEAPPASPVDETPASAPVATPPPPAPVAEVATANVTAAEAAALLGVDHDATDAEHAAAAKPPSILVRVLQLINSPMSWLSDAVRDALGKVALLTLFNAVAVLVYVLVFRRHGK